MNIESTCRNVENARRIREDVLRDPAYPVHRIADELMPYLRVLIEQFDPENVILFGSYANGVPDRHSDVDLLVVRECEDSSIRQRIAIRDAWWKMPHTGPLLPFDLIVVTPAQHQERLAAAAGFYDSIVKNGLPLL